jgi:HK97 family phage major capsid protein
MDFGKRAFPPHPLAKLIKVSKKLLHASAIDIPNLIADRFAYNFGITEEKAFLLGNGSQQPLGVFTASPLGRKPRAGSSPALGISRIGQGTVAIKENSIAEF